MAISLLIFPFNYLTLPCHVFPASCLHASLFIYPFIIQFIFFCDRKPEIGFRCHTITVNLFLLKESLYEHEAIYHFDCMFGFLTFDNEQLSTIIILDFNKWYENTSILVTFLLM